MEDTRIWISPIQCGCEIEINAYWPNPPMRDGQGRNISYMHPIPYTVRSLRTHAVCAQHADVVNAPLDDSHFFDLDENGDPVQKRGVLKYPIKAPSDEEKLYTFLYSFTAQRVSLDTCGCQVMQAFNRFDPEAGIVGIYRLDSKKCKIHESDDDQHTQATAENLLKSNAVNAIIELDPTLTEDKITWVYDQNRKLQVSVAGATAQEKLNYEAQIVAKVGTGKASVI